MPTIHTRGTTAGRFPAIRALLSRRTASAAKTTTTPASGIRPTTHDATTLRRAAGRFGIAGTAARDLARICLSALLYLGCGSISHSSLRFSNPRFGEVNASGWNGDMTYELSGPCVSDRDALERTRGLLEELAILLPPDTPTHVACTGGHFRLSLRTRK
ncbi:MAG: hypothetical protein HY696_01205 [Deltaproteobacteria bacterium]|nr:hypothetical protein [Deltaproteobacteria bacterium]